jgi:CRP-like cAMP-binding protein
LPVTYPHEKLDAMIGAKRVAVTRALRRREEEGAGSSGGRRICVGYPQALQRIAQQER